MQGMRYILLLLLYLTCLTHFISGEDDEFPDVDDEDGESWASAPASKAIPATVTQSAPTTSFKQDHIPQNFEYDEEEFEGLPPLGQTPDEPHSTQGSTSHPAEPSFLGSVAQALRRKPPTRQEHFYYEGLCGAFILVYGINWFFGRRTNEEVAKSWVKQHKTQFQEQFSRIGVGTDKNDQGIAEPLLLKDSASDFEFYASGRTNCRNCLVNLCLRKRQDLITRVQDLFRPSYDKLIMEVAMNDDCLEPFCLVVAKSGTVLETIKKEHPDVVTYAAAPISGAIHGLPEDVAILTDSFDQPSKGSHAIIPDFMVQIINHCADWFVSLHVSDQLCTTDLQLAAAVANTHSSAGRNVPIPQFCRKAIQFTFKIPPPEHSHKMTTLLQMAFHMIDHFAALRLSSNTKQKNMLIRAQVLEVATEIQQQQQDDPKKKRKDKKVAEERQPEIKLRRKEDERRRRFSPKGS